MLNASELRAGAKGDGIYGWSQSGDVYVGVTSSKAHMQADFRGGPRGQSYTIQFGIQKDDPNDYVRPWADITWMINGNAITRRVSVSDGLSVAGQAETVKVDVYDSLRVGTDVGAVQDTHYLVNINIAPGTRPSQDQPPQWIPIEYLDDVFDPQPTSGLILVPPMTSYSIVPPSNIGIISAYVVVRLGTATLAPTDARFEQYGGAGVGSVIVRSNYANELGAFIPIAPGAFRFQMTNSHAIGTELWSVGFGIDG